MNINITSDKNTRKVNRMPEHQRLNEINQLAEAGQGASSRCRQLRLANAGGDKQKFNVLEKFLAQGRMQ